MTVTAAVGAKEIGEQRIKAILMWPGHRLVAPECQCLPYRRTAAFPAEVRAVGLSTVGLGLKWP
jgi:hypothetical protein